MNVEILTIGDELLLGLAVDTNAPHIAAELARVGAVVVRHTTVGDDPGAIAAATREALTRADGVITTGGLGPTADDCSRRGVAAAFARQLVVHQPTLVALEERWRLRGLSGDLPEPNRRQALVPAGAEVLPNPYGTAPGIWMDRDDGRWVAVLPGVPREMREMLTDTVLPRVSARFAGARVVASRTLRTTGVPESRVAARVEGVRLPHAVRLAWLPWWGGVDLRVTARGLPPRDADRALAEAVDALRARVGDVVFGEDADDLAAVVLDALAQHRVTVGVAESCTGGLLGARLTAVPGASAWFRGGIVAYDNTVKINVLGVGGELLAGSGAVSEAAARAMAEGARAVLGAAVGVAITGIAGPAGGTPDKPVGTVCLAVATPWGTSAQSVRLPGDREEIRLRASQAALEFLRRALRSGGTVAPTVAAG